MAGRIKFLLLYFFTWIFFFECARLAFLFYNAGSRTGSPDINLSFLYGLRMDASMAGYLVLPLCFFVLAGLFLPFFQRPTIYKRYTYIILFFLLLIITADLEVYKSWGFRIDATPLRYLSSPKEAWASISHLPIVLILFLFLVLYAALCLFFKWFIQRFIPFRQTNQSKWFVFAVVFFLTAVLVIPIRGGFQLVPLNQSSVYFSKDNFSNMAAINAPWNFLYAITTHTVARNPYKVLDSRRATSIVDSLLHGEGSNQKILKTNRPNVIVVIWESFTEKATHAMPKGIEVTPHFNALKKEGIYFSQVYASGDRTDKGLAAVLSGYPALNRFSIIYMPTKSARLPSLSAFFKGLGYRTSFYYGGEPEFANIKSYVIQSHYDTLIEKASFNEKDLNSKWGAHDGVVAQRILKDMDTIHQPFFTTWLTLSSHEPFETPVPTVIDGNSVEEKFMNSLHYTDAVLNELIQNAKQKSWWSNTVVIIVADHGHWIIRPSTRLNNHKIPMLWLGGALDTTGMDVSRVSSQTDVTTTLEKQVEPSASMFPFSKNIFDSTQHAWAYFSFNDGFGFVQPGKAFVYDNIGKRMVYKTRGTNQNDIEAGEAFQQFIFQDYLNK